MKNRDEYYNRILKIVGSELLQKKISVHNVSFFGKAIELLASCGVLKYEFQACKEDSAVEEIMGISENGENFSERLSNHLRSYNHLEDRWSFIGKSEKPNLVLAGGTLGDCCKGILEAKKKNIPAIIGFLLQGGISFMQIIMPGEELPDDLQLKVDTNIESRIFDWIDLNNQVANLAKAIMLRGTEWERPDINDLLDSGKASVVLAHHSWPWVNRYLDIRDKQEKGWLSGILVRGKETDAQNYDLSGKTVMVVGLGCIGSVAADYFRILGANIVGIDGKKVSLHNPVRQLYSTKMIDVEKSLAFSQTLGSRSGLNDDMQEVDGVNKITHEGRFFAGIKMVCSDTDETEEKFKKLLEQFKPDLVLLATAHTVEFRLAWILKQKQIPHISAGCYARARWFELICVDRNNGPCYGCFRGHLYKGSQASLTEEEQMRCGMDDMEAGMIQSEPATRIETSRCADSVARIGVQLLLDDSARSKWFKCMMSEGQNCLIGGNTSEWSREKEAWAYNIETPGKAVLLGVGDFIGSGDVGHEKCIYCGRENNISVQRSTTKLDLPTDVAVPFFKEVT